MGLCSAVKRSRRTLPVMAMTYMGCVPHRVLLLLGHVYDFKQGGQSFCLK